MSDTGADASTRLRLARGVSIVGHPFFVMPLAGLGAAYARGAGSAQLLGLGAALLAVVIAIQGWSRWQVRRGRWAHVDASARAERRSLNGLLLALFTFAAAGAWLAGAADALVRAFALAAAIIVVAMLCARWFKLSLHVAFAVFAAFIGGTWLVGGGLLVLAAGVAWSRLVLARHTMADLIAGAAVGALAGAAFLFA